MTQAIEANLDEVVGDSQSRRISVYWPIRGEPDLQAWMLRHSDRGALFSLPIVMGKEQALVFRTWRPSEPLVEGAWGISIPASGQLVQPDIVIAPVIGFDSACYRLGYGGGFFDRTLASMTNAPFVIGVGYELGRLDTIFPQEHDIPMDVVVTEERILTPSGQT